ncbi:MAG: hypothetical protein GX621_17395 [Pirellulaceae bacterium]|nr:hypothetical protein [Pirellulaceae bacterium]
MQLDNTRIVIRERSFAEVLDLSLRVTRRYFGPLVVTLILGIAPLFALNAYLLSDMVEEELEATISPGYVLLLPLLILWQIPLATAPATLYLGQAVFLQRPSGRRVASDLARSAPQLLLYQVLLRAVLVWPLVTWLWLFGQYAYLNEVILLERNPLRQRSPGKPSTERRCRTLLAGAAGDMWVRAMASAGVAAILLLSFSSALWVAVGLFVGEWDLDGFMLTHGYHVALWLVAGFFTVVRFLGYLDLRIRREGWEVELVMRAESELLAGPETA